MLGMWSHPLHCEDGFCLKGVIYCHKGVLQGRPLCPIGSQRCPIPQCGQALLPRCREGWEHVTYCCASLPDARGPCLLAPMLLCCGTCCYPAAAPPAAAVGCARGRRGPAARNHGPKAPHLSHDKAVPRAGNGPGAAAGDAGAGVGLLQQCGVEGSWGVGMCVQCLLHGFYIPIEACPLHRSHPWQGPAAPGCEGGAVDRVHCGRDGSCARIEFMKMV